MLEGILHSRKREPDGPVGMSVQRSSAMDQHTEAESPGQLVVDGPISPVLSGFNTSNVELSHRGRPKIARSERTGREDVSPHRA